MGNEVERNGLAGLSIAPAEIHLQGGLARQQIVVTGHLPGDPESLHDLTAEVRFSVEPGEIAEVSEFGVVTPLANGRAYLRVEAGGQAAEVPIEVVDVAEVRAVSYRHDVAPVFSRAGCNMGACHGNLNGKGGFRLSLRGEDPGFDLDMITRDTFGRRIDTNNPSTSLLVKKPAGLIAHEGGRRFTFDSPETRVLLEWIAAGAPEDVDQVPDLVKLSVFPEHRINAAPDLGQQLIVKAEFADGTVRDVTHQATFDVDDPTQVEVNEQGRAIRNGPGESVVAVRFLEGRAVSRLAFLPDRPDFVWNGPEPRTDLDLAVFEKLKAHKIQASPPAPDSVFIRRAYLDAIGILPDPEEVRAFLEDDDPEKRIKLVDRLLDRPEFADYWALKWADLLRNEEKTMGPKGVWTFQRWLRDQIDADVPLNEFAAALIVSKGSTWANPPASFHRTNRDPETAAETVGQVFLGVRLQCARCHNHPFDSWTMDDYYGLAAYFSNVERKEINNERRDRLNSHEINGDVMVMTSGRPGMVQPRSGERLQPAPPGVPRSAWEGTPNGEEALESLADWLTTDNRQFARNLANRAWFHLLGRGIVEPVDDFRESNPPANPELLEHLTDAFIENGLRLRPLVRLIMTSEVYGLGSRPDPTNLDDEINFARASVRMLPAEVLLDAIGQALGKAPQFEGAPAGARAVQLAGASMGGDFLKVFGKPDRLLTCECERSETTTLAQAFQLINGEAVRDLIEAKDNRIGRWLEANTDPEMILEDLYIAALSREPTSTEREAALGHVASAENERSAWEDVSWAILNSKEFLLRH